MKLDYQDWYEIKAIAAFVLLMPFIWMFWIAVIFTILGIFI